MPLLSNQVELDLVSNFKKLGIQIFAIVNNNGRIIYSEKFDTLCLKSNKIEMFLMELALQHSMLRDFDEEFGVVNFCVTQRNNRKFFSIPTMNNHTILMVTEKNFEHEPLEETISQILKYSERLLEKPLSNGATTN